MRGNVGEEKGAGGGQGQGSGPKGAAERDVRGTGGVGQITERNMKALVGGRKRRTARRVMAPSKG